MGFQLVPEAGLESRYGLDSAYVTAAQRPLESLNRIQSRIRHTYHTHGARRAAAEALVALSWFSVKMTAMWLT